MTSLIEVLSILEVSSMLELRHRFLLEDQRLMEKKAWTPDDSTLFINRVKIALEALDPATLDDVAFQNWRQMLWLWNHRAVSFAVFTLRDKMRAKEYAARAMIDHGGRNPNRITRLWFHLLYGQMKEARDWAGTITSPKEISTARLLLAWFEENKLT